jgi:hypothetical protein
VHAWEITDEEGLLEAEPGPQEAATSILSPAQYPMFICFQNENNAVFIFSFLSMTLSLSVLDKYRWNILFCSHV